MRRGHVVLLPGLILLQFCAGVVLAQSLEQADPLTWLERIAKAARQLNYSGTYVYQHGDQVETSRITHFFDRNGELEKLETLDGPKREVIRTNNEILTYDFEHRIIKRERRAQRRNFPNLLPDQLASLTEYYQLRKGEHERIAGYDSQALILTPKDAYRYGHKLWADTNTGLLLKARMVDENDHVVEQFVFTQLTMGAGVTRDATKPSVNGATDWQREPAPPEASEQVDTGWIVKSQPSGFKKVMEMKRLKNGTRAPVAHLVYSDGLAAVSVFIEPLPVKRKFQEGLTRQGAFNIYTKPLPDQLVTVLGEAPALTVTQMANSVSQKGQ